MNHPLRDHSIEPTLIAIMEQIIVIERSLKTKCKKEILHSYLYPLFCKSLASLKKEMLLMVEVEERLHLVPEEDSPELEAEDEQNQNPNWCQISSYFLMTKIEKRCYFATEEYSSRLESEEEEKLRIIPEEEAIRLMAKD